MEVKHFKEHLKYYTIKHLKELKDYIDEEINERYNSPTQEWNYNRKGKVKK